MYMYIHTYNTYMYTYTFICVCMHVLLHTQNIPRSQARPRISTCDV